MYNKPDKRITNVLEGKCKNDFMKLIEQFRRLYSR